MAVEDVRVFVRIALLLAMTLSLALVACGGSDDDGGDAAAQLRDAATTTEDGGSSSRDEGSGSAEIAVSGSPQRQVQTIVTKVQKAVGTGDAQLICDNITAAAREAAAERAKAFDGSTCLDNFTAIAKDHVKGSKPPKITSVVVNGDTATVSLREPIDGKKFELPVHKEDGAWKLDLIDPGASQQPTSGQ